MNKETTRLIATKERMHTHTHTNLPVGTFNQHQQTLAVSGTSFVLTQYVSFLILFIY